MPSGGVIVICALIAMTIYGGDKVVHGVTHGIKKIERPVCHFVTLGEKCKKHPVKPIPPVPAPPSN